ncbi:hypothetical protein QIS99_28190 [Streptomyces sp. B-S-A8]|uniref:Uncharacterized protein n=1 Tax=Streptomyces solicavernae TaxID=3043614 RepID=A0ABT6S029_9ACTN|nr:hypothetical protein [Streptomyces sp. B-S-A8]MDI3390042.1 hypothetical protein [Streptomyces sp. B-S-A8]
MLPEIMYWAFPRLLLVLAFALAVVVRRHWSRSFPPVWRFLVVRPLWWLVMRALGYEDPATIYPRFRNRVRVAWERRLMEWLER